MALVQSKQGSVLGSSLTITLDSPTTAGNGLIVLVATSGSSTNPTVGSITLGGSAGNFGGRGSVGTSSDGGISAVWDDLNCAGGQTSVVITVTGGSGSFAIWACVMEWNDLLTSAAFDKITSGGVAASGTSWDSGSTATTAQPSEVWVGFAFGINMTTGVTITPPGSLWTNLAQITEQVLSGFAGVARAGYQVVSATGTARYNGTFSSSEQWVALAATYKLAAAAALPQSVPGPQIPPGRMSPAAWARLRPRTVIEPAAAVSPDVAVTAGLATAAASAPAPVPAATANAGLASATGSSPAPKAVLTCTTGLAAATGTAPAPATAVIATAGLAAATGTAPAPATAVIATAGLAAATGTAPAPVPAVAANAGLASASGTAPAATVITSAQGTAPAGLAAATGTAPAPATAVIVNAGLAAAAVPGPVLAQFPAVAGGAGTTLTVTLSQPTTAGNCLIALVGSAANTTNGTVSGITLGGSADHFAVVASKGTGSDHAIVTCWADPNCAGGQTSVAITTTGSVGNSALSAAVYEVSAMPGTVPALLDQQASFSSAGFVASWTLGPTSTTAQPSEAWFAIVAGNVSASAAGTVTGPGAPWANTALPGVNNYVGGISFNGVTGYQAVTTTGTASFNGTTSPNSTLDGLVVTLKAAVPAPLAPVPAVTAMAGLATGTGTAPAPSVSTAAGVTALAGPAAATASAAAPLAGVTALAGPAAATASAAAPLAGVTALAGPAAAAGPGPLPVLAQSPAANSSTGTTLTVALAQPTTAGNCLIVLTGTAGFSANGTVSGITLGGSADHFAVVASKGTSGDHAIVSAWADPNCAGGQTSIAITTSGSSGTQAISAVAYEITAMPATVSALLDQQASFSSAGFITSWTLGPTGTTAQPVEAWFAIVAGNVSAATAGTATGPGPPWASRTLPGVNNYAGGFSFGGVTGYQTAQAAGTASFNGTVSPASTLDGLVVTLKAVSRAPSSAPLPVIAALPAQAAAQAAAPAPSIQSSSHITALAGPAAAIAAAPPPAALVPFVVDITVDAGPTVSRSQVLVSAVTADDGTAAGAVRSDGTAAAPSASRAQAGAAVTTQDDGKAVGNAASRAQVPAAAAVQGDGTGTGVARSDGTAAASSASRAQAGISAVTRNDGKSAGLVVTERGP